MANLWETLKAPLCLHDADTRALSLHFHGMGKGSLQIWGDLNILLSSYTVNTWLSGLDVYQPLLKLPFLQ